MLQNFPSKVLPFQFSGQVHVYVVKRLEMTMSFVFVFSGSELALQYLFWKTMNHHYFVDDSQKYVCVHRLH